MEGKLTAKSEILINSATIANLVEWFVQKENMSHKKIQKLCYYAQAWSQTLEQVDIVEGIEFEAWVHGPVNRKIWDMCKGFGWRDITITKETLEQSKEECDAVFNEKQKEILDLVWETYGIFDADELEALTHEEQPWREKRLGKMPFEKCTDTLSRETMREFYITQYEA